VRGRLVPLAALAATLAFASLAAALPGCGDDPITPAGSSSGVAGSGGGTASASASGSGGRDSIPPEHAWTDCQSSDQAWIRRAFMAISGRRSWGQAEINAYEDVLKGVRAASGGDPTKPAPAGADLEPAKRLVARAMMEEDAYRERWSDFVMDALHTVRIEAKSQESCYGALSAVAVDDGGLAVWVRDNDATAQGAPLQGFTMGDLLSSALQLDDLSVVYRGHLFAMMNLPLIGANVDFFALERVRRQDFGAVFDSAYIHRDVVCLSCHNSEYSVTQDDDPTKNRAWPVPGLFEVALFGSSSGKHPPEEEATQGPDDLRAHSMLRVADVVDGSGTTPFGWSGQCGAFSVPQVDDPLHIDTYFGSIKSTPTDPSKGLRASVWDLEASLHKGVDLLAAHGLRRLPGDVLADPDEAFAYLVAENIVEEVWAEIMGSQLTIANYFARTAVQRDILFGLTERFVASHFSLKTLLLDILAHPAFNLEAPDEGCGTAYELPTVFDPWTTSEGDPLKRGNSPADGVFALSARPLVRSLHRAMEWPMRSEFPIDDAETSFQSAVGLFLKDADPGYRGLDFQGRLTWEATYAGCPNLSGNDFITRIVARAFAVPGATVGDGILALKDRLTGEPTVDAKVEKPALEALIGGSLASVDLGNLDAKLRTVCGVLVSTPQHMLGGIPPKDTRDVPRLTPPDVTYQGACGVLSSYLASAGTPYIVVCGAASATVTRK